MKRVLKGNIAIGIALAMMLNDCGTREGMPNNVVKRDALTAGYEMPPSGETSEKNDHKET